jgi:hypothetical protein
MRRRRRSAGVTGQKIINLRRHEGPEEGVRFNAQIQPLTRHVREQKGEHEGSDEGGSA